MPDCPSCGAALQESARFCPECGTRLDGGTAHDPQSSTFTAERHVFGLAPPEILVAFALLMLVVGVFSLAFGHWIAGIVLIVAGAALWWLFTWTAQRLPDGRAAHLATAATAAGDAARSRAGFAWVSLSSWSGVGVKALRLRRVQRRLAIEQSALIHALGEAVFREDVERADELKDKARACAERIEENEKELRLALEAARERVSRERAAIQPTEAFVEPSETPTSVAPQAK
jgi:hypothetical protein